MSVGSIKTLRIGNGEEPFTAGARIEFRDGTTPVPSPGMDFYIGRGAAAFSGGATPAPIHTMSMTDTVSVLHGIWEADATITTSDRRLKTSIEPLYRTIEARAKARWSDTETEPEPGDTNLRGNARSSTTAIAGPKKEDAPIGWLLRELRPVSFKLKSGPEAKYLKFGFIAQELETIFPNLVRNVGGAKGGSEEGTKAIASQDLIAVLTLALQSLQKDMEKQRDWMRQEVEEQRRLLASLIVENRDRMDRLERAIFATRV